MREQRTAMGRPVVIVQADHDDLPELDVTTRNVSEGAAKGTTFEFSAPLENSGGFSSRTCRTSGTGFLPPCGELNCYRGDLNALIPFLEARNLRGGITVIVRYKDLSGAPYESRWRLNPFLYKDTRLVRAVEKLQE